MQRNRDEGSQVTTVRLPATPASAAALRHQITADLTEQPVAPALIDDVVLVATELVTNAIRHAEPLVGGQVTVTWTVDGGSVLIRVTDGGGASRPRVRHPSPRETSGRGLALVEALATHWGVEDTAGATTVWATIGG
jgi:serine/threonine-protein kinase RsbW